MHEFKENGLVPAGNAPGEETAQGHGRRRGERALNAYAGSGKFEANSTQSVQPAPDAPDGPGVRGRNDVRAHNFR